MKSNLFSIAQISDSHLFADKAGKHCDQNVLRNLNKVLAQIRERNVDLLVFTGDLTQDHTEESYRNFNSALYSCDLSVPIFMISGNHDDPLLMQECITHPMARFDKTYQIDGWQLLMLDSKSETPAGRVSLNELKWLETHVDSNHKQLLFMHHHPEDIGYFIDRHGLQNQATFWQTINQFPTVKAIACGHVHRGSDWIPAQSTHGLNLHTCPATSIQFDPSVDTVAALPIGAGFRLFELCCDGTYSSSLVYLDFETS